MIGKLLKLKKNKLLFSLFIVCACVIFFDVFVFVFDLVQVLSMNKNTASFSKMFVPLNIIMICFNVCTILLIVGYLIYRRVKGNGK